MPHALRDGALILWIVAVLFFWWVGEPGPNFRRSAARVEFLAQTQAVLKPLFYRDHII